MHWGGKMKRNSVILILVALILFAVLAIPIVSTPSKGAVQRFFELQDKELGTVYVIGHYEGFLNGWDVAFFHRDTQSNWLGYYLAHESRSWKKVNLQYDGKLVTVNNGNTKVAEYDVASGSFTHKSQGVTYSIEDAKIDWRCAKNFNLSGIINLRSQTK
jgi:hypothetical protein